MSSAAPRSSIHALFPGTFDPVTLGHLDVIRRAASLFGRVTVAIAGNPSKRELLSLEQRLELLREATADIGGVAVARLDGLVIDGCAKLGAQVIVRGVRSAHDFEYEAQMGRSNRAMAPAVETVFLASDPEHVHISSTLVRQVAACGGPLEPFVPPSVARALRAATQPHPHRSNA
jgi:pantetheine-phosphate adenylyltransferase